MEIAYIGLGSNLGNRERYLLSALEKLKKDAQIVIKKVSSIYETAPVGVVDQPLFLNMVIEIETAYSPIELLNCLQVIENGCKRKRERKWGPRTLDLDILLFNQENMKSERLEIPHPRMKERGFVLIPLYEINPHLVNEKFFKEFEKVCQSKSQGVKLWKRKSEFGCKFLSKEGE